MRKREGADFGWLSLVGRVEGYFPALSRLRTRNKLVLTMNHSFSVEHAMKYGLQEAILIGNLQFWLAKNRADKRNQYDGRTWTYNTANAFSELLPYFSTDAIDRIIKKLVKQEVILLGNYNAKAYDRTRWIAFVNEVEFLGPVRSAKNEGKGANDQAGAPSREIAEGSNPPAKSRNGSRDSTEASREIAESLYRTDVNAVVNADGDGAAAPTCPTPPAASGSAAPQPPAQQAAVAAAPSATAGDVPQVKSKSVDFLVAKGVDYQVAVDWMLTRKAKPVTPTVWSLIEEEAAKAGITAVAAVTWSAGRSKMNFMADWYTAETPKVAGAVAPAGVTKYPAKPNLMDANRAAVEAFRAERAAAQCKNMGEVERVVEPGFSEWRYDA